MKQTEINEVLMLHKRWLNGENGGKQADFRGANLSGANLYKAYLKYADFRGADLRGAYLRYADLRDACLIGANIRYACLIGAELSGAELSGANFEGCLKIPMYCKWNHGITDGMIHIGCEKRTIGDWDEFFASDEVIQTPRGTEEFKQVEAVYLAYKAYLTHLNTKEK